MDHFSRYLEEIGREPCPVGTYPKTDDILRRSINLSVGVVDPGLGAGFGISIMSTDEEIDQAVARFKQACDETA
jgi:hypothetical protein